MACALLLTGAHAQNYPAKTIRIVTPYAPGGTADIMARLVALKLAEAWGHQVVVDNRPGASGMIGAELAAKAPPDGYTILMAYTTEIAIVPSLYPKMSYDPIKDLAPVALAAITPMILVVHPSLPARNVKELVALAKARPGQLPYASAGNGSPAHLAFELLKRTASIEITHVPYKGGGQALIDTLAGHVVMFFSSMPSAMPHINSGRLRAIAVSTAKRSPAAPGVPSVAESGMRNFDINTWNAVFAPAATPKDIIAKLNAEILRALGQPDVKDRLVREGAEVVPNTPEQFRSFLQTEVAKFAKIIQESGARPD
jgi:tripartite-type tricarboxylate transporter receptor subunit TctC